MNIIVIITLAITIHMLMQKKTPLKWTLEFQTLITF